MSPTTFDAERGRRNFKPDPFILLHAILFHETSWASWLATVGSGNPGHPLCELSGSRPC